MNVGRALSPTAIAFGCCLLAANPAAAQAPTALGPSVSATANVLNHVSYDDKHHVYLQAYELNSLVYGRFIGADGTVLGTPFLISTVVGTNGYNWAGDPKVAYSRGSSVDTFMVMYVGANGPNALLAQMVQYTGQGATGGQLNGSAIVVNKYQSSYQRGDDLVFNPVDGRFLAVWEELLGNGYEVIARAYLGDGTGVGAGPINVSNVSGSQGLAQAAFDWSRDHFVIAWQGDSVANGPVGIFGKVVDGSGTPITAQITIYGGASFEPSCIYLPERDGFVVGYTAFKPDRFVGARFVPSNYTGSLPDPGFTALDTAGNDGYSTGEYDWVSRFVFMGAMSDTSGRFVRGSVLNGTGTPVVPAFVINSVLSGPNGAGLFYPTIRAAEDGKFGFSYDVDYGLAAFERYQFGAASVPGPHFAGGPPPPPPGGVLMNLDIPGTGTITPPFAVGGWAVDTRSQNDNGIDVIHIWAVPTNGSQAVFVGLVSPDGDRTDIEQLFGPLHKKSGYGTTMSNLPPGQYNLVLYPHSSVTGDFDYSKVQTRLINVNGSVLTSIESPNWGQSFQSQGVNMSITGYAINLAAQTGTGIDAVHVWAIDPFGAQPPLFLGAASYGANRPDVASKYGAQFANSGFALTNPTPISLGMRYILVYSFNAGSQTPNIARLVGVFINQ